MQKAEIEKRMKKIADRHPNPHELLAKQLHTTLTIFVPRDSDQALDFFIEHLLVTCKMAAMVMSCHISGHAELSKDCVPHMHKAMPMLFKQLTAEMLKELCEVTGLENPLIAPDTNESTRKEILDELKRGVLHD